MDTKANDLIAAEMNRIQGELDAARRRYLNMLIHRVPGGPLEVQKVTQSTLDIVGYACIFDTPGLDGGRFDRDTSLRMPGQPEEQGLFAVPHPGIYWDHGFDEVIQHTRLGETQEATPDAKGVWIRATLDRAKEYMEWIEELLQSTEIQLGLSGGSTVHLNKWVGETRVDWPVVEISITPTPAQPLTLGVKVLQSLKPGAVDLIGRLESRNRDLVPSAVLESAASQDAADESAEQTGEDTGADSTGEEQKQQQQESTQSVETQTGEPATEEAAAPEVQAPEGSAPAAHDIRVLANLLALERERTALAQLQMEMNR